MKKTVIFDMDGVLLDTERLMLKYWEQAALEIGFKEYKEAQVLSVGRNKQGVADLFAEKYPYVDLPDFQNRFNSYIAEHIKRTGVPVKPGVCEAVKLVSEKGYKVAVATSTSSEHAFPQLEEAGVAKYCIAIMTGDKVTKGKPDPEIYLKAAKAVDADPADCYAVEDSPNGIKSAFLAGETTVFLPDVTLMPKEYDKYINLKFDTILDFAKSLDKI